MSVAAPAAKPLSRRTLERSGMTPEQELELLIAEQKRDDTDRVDRPSFVISLDAPTPDGKSTMLDLVGYDEDGQLVSFIPGTRDCYDPRAITHGTRGAYTKFGCKCPPCRKANSDYIAEYRARRKSEQ